MIGRVADPAGQRRHEIGLRCDKRGIRRAVRQRRSSVLPFRVEPEAAPSMPTTKFDGTGSRSRSGRRPPRRARLTPTVVAPRGKARAAKLTLSCTSSTGSVTSLLRPGAAGMGAEIAARPAERCGERHRRLHRQVGGDCRRCQNGARPATREESVCSCSHLLCVPVRLHRKPGVEEQCVVVAGHRASCR